MVLGESGDRPLAQSGVVIGVVENREAPDRPATIAAAIGTAIRAIGIHLDFMLRRRFSTGIYDEAREDLRLAPLQ